jgi:Protein kinase domain
MVAATPSRLRFGDYDIERKLGHGMTDAYLGWDVGCARRAVLKIIRHSAEAKVRQVIEAERRGAAIQQQLHAFDARVLEVYDFGDLEGCFYVAMEYVEGETVAQMLKRERRIDAMRATRIAAEVAAQLEALHSFQAQIDGRAAAVVHGDIKPSNIQLGADGRIRLLDFGIAKSVTVLRNLTVHQFGSPNYCSPERLDRSQVDTDSDLWALGVTLYEMVAGSPPYQAEDTRRLEGLIQSRRPPRALPGACPRGLKAIVGKALAADPAQRYGTASNFREDLAAFLENRPTVAERERRRPWHVNPTVDAGGRRPEWWKWLDLPYARLAGALGCVLLGMLVFLASGYYWRYRSEADRFRARLDLSHRAAAEVSAPAYELTRLRAEFGFLGQWSPVDELAAALRAAYVSAADAVIDGYRTGSSPAVASVDWPKAQVCLEQALAIDAGDRAVRGKLALVRAYLSLARELHDVARSGFLEAAAALPVSPDPHLGLARLYVYSSRDTERALTEFALAETLGYRLQPREIEQKADAYRFRAWTELGTAWGAGVKAGRAAQLQALGQRDLEAAEALYQQIPGFNHVDAHLKQVRAVYAKTLPSPPVKIVRHRGRIRGRRWR